MKDTLLVLVPVIAIVLTSCIVLAAVIGVDGPETAAQSDSSTQAQRRTDIAKQTDQANHKSQPAVEEQRKQAQQEAQKSLDQDAVAAVEETQKAIDAIGANKTDEALAAIERATGKLNILLARNPSTALLPVDFQVSVIDTAPHDHEAILDLAKDASRAVDDRDFPAARVVLHNLMSEIRVRTFTLPLATYPAALQQAARLLDQKKNQEARDVLLTALNTLVAVDRVTPIPILVAREAVSQAQSEGQKDKAHAQRLLEVARNELLRSRELGYAGRDPEYAALNDQISNLEKQLKGNGGDLSAVYARLKDRLSAFLKRQSEHQQHA